MGSLARHARDRHHRRRRGHRRRHASSSGCSRAKDAATTRRAGARRRWSTPARPRRGSSHLAVTHAAGKRWIVAGLGDARRVRRARRARRRGRRRWPRAGARHPDAVLGAAAPARPRRRRPGRGRGHAAGAYRFDRFKTGAADGTTSPTASTALIVSDHDDRSAAVARAPRSSPRPSTRARDLQNTPANHMTPDRPRRRAQAIAASTRRAAARSSAATASSQPGWAPSRRVAQGTDEEPQLIVLRYEPEGRGRAAARPRRQGSDVRHRRHLDQAGAGRCTDMKFDMSRRRGGARGARARSPRSACRCACSAVVAATENMPSGRGDEAGRHRKAVERQDDRDQQHRRRGPAGARRRLRHAVGPRAPSGSSTSRR